MALGVAEMRHFKLNRGSEGAECRGERDQGEGACGGVPRQESKCEAHGDVPKGLRHRSLANLGLTGSQPKRVARTARLVGGLQAALILPPIAGG
jgi:hypothetical protein